MTPRCFTPENHGAEGFWREYLADLIRADEAAEDRARAHLAEAAAQREAQA